MESVKPILAEDAIFSLLREIFEDPILDLAPVQGGLIAQVFSFRAGEKEYILRFTKNVMEATYRKETFIHQHFASASIPVPPILKVGLLGDLFYAVTEKMAGKGLTFLSEEEYRKTIPSLMQTLYAIHQVDVQDWDGFGWFDDHGTGMFPSWKAFLASIIEEERQDGFYGKWHTLFRTTFLDRDFFENVYGHMTRLLDSLPEERWLVHGGYGYNNVLAHEGRVSAVLDWIDAMYGDFVYDIAGLDEWPPFGIDYPGLFHEYYTRQGLFLPNFRERLVCYRLRRGLDGLRFFAKTNNENAYQSVCQKLENLLKRSG
jgi:hygromycin-B 4-O-kinase